MRGVLDFVLPDSDFSSMKIRVFEDNQGTKDLAENPLSSSNSKHIDVRHHFLRELVSNGDISVEYLNTKEHADILTKALSRESFEVHRDFLIGQNE